MARRRKRKRINWEIVLITFLAVVLVGLGVWGIFFIYPSTKLQVDFKKDLTEIQFGSEFDPVALELDALSLGLTEDYKIDYKYDLTKIGKVNCEITVSKGRIKKTFRHQLWVVDRVPPTFTVKYQIVSTSNLNQDFRSNIKGKIMDDHDGELSHTAMKFHGLIASKPGIYPVEFEVSDSSGNTATQTVFYLYRLTAENIKEPYRFTWGGQKHIITNKWLPLPKKYKPGVNSTARKNLNNMLKAMKKDGVGVSLKSGYRASGEHQTGLAFDIGSTSLNFAKTKAYQWLQQHGHEYGFILRYPEGKEKITGFSYEPWHYRYLGVELATAIYQERNKNGGDPDLTLEEFIGYRHE